VELRERNDKTEAKAPSKDLSKGAAAK
jgi:hypothetical protein